MERKDTKIVPWKTIFQLTILKNCDFCEKNFYERCFVTKTTK